MQSYVLHRNKNYIDYKSIYRVQIKVNDYILFICSMNSIYFHFVFKIEFFQCSLKAGHM